MLTDRQTDSSNNPPPPSSLASSIISIYLHVYRTQRGPTVKRKFNGLSVRSECQSVSRVPFCPQSFSIGARKRVRNFIASAFFWRVLIMTVVVHVTSLGHQCWMTGIEDQYEYAWMLQIFLWLRSRSTWNKVESAVYTTLSTLSGLFSSTLMWIVPRLFHRCSHDDITLLPR